MGVKTISVPDELWDKAKQQAGSRKLSEKIREMLRNYVGEENNEQYLILNKSNLAKGQKKLVKFLIEEGVAQASKAKLTQIIKQEGLYSKEGYIKSALDRITKDSVIPYKKEGRNIVSESITCKCGANFQAQVLSKTDGKCPTCGMQYIKNDTKSKEIKIGE